MPLLHHICNTFLKNYGKEVRKWRDRRYSNHISYKRSEQERHIAKQNRPSNAAESGRKCFSKEAIIQQVERRIGEVGGSASGLCNLSMQYNQKVFKKEKT